MPLYVWQSDSLTDQSSSVPLIHWSDLRPVWRPSKIVCDSVSQNHKDWQKVSICKSRTGPSSTDPAPSCLTCVTAWCRTPWTHRTLSVYCLKIFTQLSAVRLFQWTLCSTRLLFVGNVKKLLYITELERVGEVRHCLRGSSRTGDRSVIRPFAPISRSFIRPAHCQTLPVHVGSKKFTAQIFHRKINKIWQKIILRRKFLWCKTVAAYVDNVYVG